jgi:O-methyltransferase involved in polyketide biosynthesis
MKKNHQQISYTSILCARSLAENSKINYSADIWKQVKKKKYNKKEISFVIANFLAKFNKEIGLFHSFLEGRYLAINKTLKKLNNPSVIEIAAGLTPRGLEYKQKIFYVETDLPKIKKIKKDVLKQIPEGRKIKIIPLNILNKKQLFKIGEYYKKTKVKKPLAIIHSGLWTYLDKQEQKIMAKNIKEFLQKYSVKGYWISSDFRPKSLQKNIFFKYFGKGVTKKTKRPPTRFKNKKDIRKFMHNTGFNIKIISNKEIVKYMNTPKKFKLKINDVLKQSRNFEVYVMTLAN